MNARTLCGVLAAAAVTTACADSPSAPAPSPTVTLAISQEAALVARNTTVALTVTMQSGTDSPVDVTQQATWTSSNEAVASVDRGIVSVKALGAAQITASFGGRQVSALVTGRRRTHINGPLTARDANGETSIVGLRTILDGSSLTTLSASDPVNGGAVQVSWKLWGSTPPKSTDPGSHALGFIVFLEDRPAETISLATALTIIDSDTGEAVGTIAIPEERVASVVKGGERQSEFAWTIEVPVFTQ